MTLKQRSAVEVLKSAQTRVLGILEKYNAKLSAAEKEKALADASFELSVLSVLELEVFYPAVTDTEGVSVDRFVENHDKMKIMVAQAQRLMGDEADFDSSMEELTNAVKSHIKEEETDLFPKIEKSSLDLNTLGEGLDKKREDVTGKVVF